MDNVTQQAATLSPRDKMLQSFPDSKETKENSYLHPDNPRFLWWVKDQGNIGIKPLTGRDAAQVLAMGNPPLKFRDLYATPGKRPSGTYQPPTVLTLLDMEQYLKLPRGFLANMGYEDYSYRDTAKGITREGVKVGGYYAPDGTPHTRNKVRLSIDPEAKPRFLWDINQPGDPIPCGLHTLGMARDQGYLAIGEGESDYATALFHGLPFIGISGADAYRQLDMSLVLDIPRIYILEEPDQDKKNVEKGRGFYKNMRSHLRDNGYTGEIFSVKFKRATGCKDPSDLHKLLYAHCAMNNETVSRTDLHKQFMEAMTSALDQAIPEGQECEDQGIASWIPPMPTDEGGRMNWIAELAAVPADIMGPSQKWTLVAIVLYTNVWETEEWWKVDKFDLSAKAGQSPEIFMSNLAYLSQRSEDQRKKQADKKTPYVPLFKKRHERRYHLDSKGEKTPSTDLYIQPSGLLWMAHPSTYRVADGVPERKHGGVQIPRPKCPVCQSEDIDIRHVTMCHTCHEVSHKEIYTSPFEPASMRADAPPEPAEGESDNGKLPESNVGPEPEPVESTALVMPLDEEPHFGKLPESMEEPEIAPLESDNGKLPPVMHTLSILDGQLAKVENESPSRLKPGQFVLMPDKRTGRVVEITESKAVVQVYDTLYDFTGPEREKLRTA